MADHGGYRRPTNPAPVSGPGAHSRRTDGNFQVISTAPGQDYGDATQQAAQQRSAPMGAAQPLPKPPDMPDQQAQGPQVPPFSGVPLSAPSQFPDQPVTHGVNIGAGAGTDTLQLGPFATGSQRFAPADGSMTKMLSSLAATDTTGVLADLLQHAAAQGA